MKIDAHHHLWDLQAVSYPWLMDKGTKRFFGDPAPIRRDYLLAEFSGDASSTGVGASVHIQVGAADSWAEAQWVQAVADKNQEWPLARRTPYDLTHAPDGRQCLIPLKLFSKIGLGQITERDLDEGPFLVLIRNRLHPLCLCPAVGSTNLDMNRRPHPSA
ncbi:MAG: hypothetical protein AAFV87_17725 [Pseudomonadota bacterium]